MNKKMSGMELEREIHDILNEHKTASLATCLNDVPRCSPVQYFTGNNMDIYILSAGGEKFDAIGKNHHVCLLVHSEYIDYRRIKGIQIFGTASTSLENPQLYEEARSFSPDIHFMEREKSNLKVIKIMPTEIVYLNALEDGNRTKQIYRNGEVTIKDERVLADQFS
ncbi:MAG: pyridoxamine 5'-phosphate oxidase family protein [Bacillota bacterium]